MGFSCVRDAVVHGGRCYASQCVRAPCEPMAALLSFMVDVVISHGNATSTTYDFKLKRRALCACEPSSEENELAVCCRDATRLAAAVYLGTQTRRLLHSIYEYQTRRDGHSRFAAWQQYYLGL